MNNFEKTYEEEKHSFFKRNNHIYNKDKLDSGAIKGKEIQKVPCAVKPVSCIIPRDLNLKRIFIQLFDSSFLLYDNNNIYTSLSQEQLLNRKNIIESIKKFIITHKIKYKLLYYIIYMFDILVSYNNKSKLISNLENLGLGSTILMVKFMSEEYLMISLKKFENFYGSKNYTINQLQDIEINCLKLIDYYLNFPTPFSFMELLLLNGVVFSTDNVKNEISHNIYNLILSILEKIMLKSNEYVKYNPLHLCCGVVAYCREYYQIEKWPKILSKVFNVKEKNFENIYNEFFSQYGHHYTRSSINININDKLINRKFFTEKNKSDNNKDYQSNKESRDNNNDEGVQNTNNTIFNIRVNYKTSQEIRNCALFRKMNIFHKSVIKKINDIDDINTNNVINLKNEITPTLLNEEKKSNNMNYDLNKYKSINSRKKPLINIYKTPIKFGNENDSSCFYRPNKKGVINNFHQRNSSNITISVKNNICDLLKNKRLLNNRDINSKKMDESNINYFELNNTNNGEKYDNTINLKQSELNKFARKFNNKTIDNVRPKVSLNEIEEIKVRVKNYYNINSNNKETQRQNFFNFNKFISTESDNKSNMNNNIYEKKTEDKNNKNDNETTTIEPYKNTVLWKTNNNGKSIILNENNNNNVNCKKISINRNSSCNGKYKSEVNFAQNKEEDYSNETTSENSYNCSIRRNYFKFKRFKDKLSDLNNDNTTLVNNNLTNDNKYSNKSISVIKCNINHKNTINNGIKSTKFRECLRIGYGSIDKGYHIKCNENEKNIEKEKDNKSINYTKRYMDLRSFYKMKNIKNNGEINQKTKEKNIKISRNYVFQ